MMNKVYLYTDTLLQIVKFLFFNEEGDLVQDIYGSKNNDDVWIGNVPNLDEGKYTVVCLGDGHVIGKEDIQWSGTEIIPNEVVIAKSIRTELNEELIYLVSLQNGLTDNQAIMLLELYNLMGLDPQVPLVVTKTTRTFGDVEQTIETTADSVTVTRVS